MTKPQWEKAIEFVKKGGLISAIESKYTITPLQMEVLLNAEKEFNLKNG